MVYCDARAEKQGKRLPLFIPLPPPKKKPRPSTYFLPEWFYFWKSLDLNHVWIKRTRSENFQNKFYHSMNLIFNLSYYWEILRFDA